jgi:hypothetical protein
MAAQAAGHIRIAVVLVFAALALRMSRSIRPRSVSFQGAPQLCQRASGLENIVIAKVMVHLPAFAPSHLQDRFLTRPRDRDQWRALARGIADALDQTHFNERVHERLNPLSTDSSRPCHLGHRRIAIAIEVFEHRPHAHRYARASMDLFPHLKQGLIEKTHFVNQLLNRSAQENRSFGGQENKTSLPSHRYNDNSYCH